MFTPPQRWIAGAQRWNLGNLAANASVSHDVLLSVRTGTKVVAGTGSSGGCNGGASVPGGDDGGADQGRAAGIIQRASRSGGDGERRGAVRGDDAVAEV